MTYSSIKTYGHEQGLSCVFRQWRATSHCSKLHGYALSFTIEFCADTLDERNWVVDFGALKSLKAQLVDLFDHTLVVAGDDPAKDDFLALDRMLLAKVRVLPSVGCEKFAEVVSALATLWLMDQGLTPRVWVGSVECREHGANGAKVFQTRQQARGYGKDR